MKAKNLVLPLFFFLSGILTASAQQTKVDDALLLDFYQTQRYAEAAAYLKNAYPEPVTDLKILSRLAYTYQMAGKLPDAETYYQRIYQADSTNISVLFSLAGINLTRENDNKAIAYYQRILALDSTSFMVYKQLGRLVTNPAQSLIYLQKANKINPEDDQVAASLGVCLIGLKQYKQAKKVLTTALAADSTDLILLRPMLALTYELQKYNETIRVGTQILAVGDVSYPVVSKVGESYYMLKNYQCCIETFSLLPDIIQSEASYYFVAESYKALKNYPQALDYFDLTLKQSISPNTSLYYAEMADTYNERDQLKKTIVAYQKSLFFTESGITTENGMTYYTLANLYDTKLKDKKNALKYYKKYLGTKPPEKEKTYVDYVQSRISELKK